MEKQTVLTFYKVAKSLSTFQQMKVIFLVNIEKDICSAINCTETS